MWGERIDCRRPNDCYYAHLSIYHFASAFCSGAVVLDAGSGTGYGSLYLAEHGALSVTGIDGDESAVAECRRSFQRPNLDYRVADLRRITGFPDQSFDVIVASNSLEHVVGVEAFFARARQLLKPSGLLLTAVPAARTKAAAEQELGNLHHVNIWSPDHWYRVHCKYFHNVQCHSHLLTRQNGVIRANNKPSDTVIRESDFLFPEETPEGLYREDTHGALFICRDASATTTDAMQVEPFRDHSFSRPLYPAWIQPFLWAYYRVSYVARNEGLGSVARKTVNKLLHR